MLTHPIDRSKYPAFPFDDMEGCHKVHYEPSVTSGSHLSSLDTESDQSVYYYAAVGCFLDRFTAIHSNAVDCLHEVGLYTHVTCATDTESVKRVFRCALELILGATDRFWFRGGGFLD